MEKEILVGSIIAVLLLILIIAGYYTFTRFCYRDAKGGLVCIPWPTESLLAEAVECSYYRCTKGCNSVEVQSSMFEGFRCSEWCKAEWTNTGELEGKICDSEKYPIELKEYGEEGYLIKRNFPLFDCIIHEDTKNLNFLTKFATKKIPFPNILVVDRKVIDYLQEEKEECWIPVSGTWLHEALKGFSIKDTPRTLYVTSNHVSSIIGGLDVTYIWGSYCCEDCSCEEENCIKCNEVDPSYRCYYDTINHRCNSIDTPPECTLDRVHFCTDYCDAFKKMLCKEEVSCGCKEDVCAAKCCEDIKKCSNYMDDSSCEANWCGILEECKTECYWTGDECKCR